jgi:hypothetical protein
MFTYISLPGGGGGGRHAESCMAGGGGVHVNFIKWLPGSALHNSNMAVGT